jgi:hypothetical protein
MAPAVYVLCIVTSAFCATVLWREYARTRTPLLLWSSLSFFAWAANHVLVFTDLVILPGAIDLSMVRALVALTAITLLLYGLIGDTA